MNITHAHQSLGDLIADADDAIAQLEQSRREKCQQYNEKIRKLRTHIATWHMARRNAKTQDELFDLATNIGPEILRLIRQPLAGV